MRLLYHLHHHHVVPPARISLTISRHFSLSFIASGLLGYILCPHIAAVCMFGLVVLLLLGHMRGVHSSTSLKSSSLLLQQCPGVSGSSDLYSFRDGRQVAVQLASRGVLSPGLVQYCSQHSCEVAVKFLLPAV